MAFEVELTDDDLAELESVFTNTEDKLYKPGTAQDVSSVRANNIGTGKKTADKWNQ